jgi:hypothetical protein
MPNIDLSQIPIAAVAGMVISLLFNWLPFLAPWYDQLTPTPKKLVMIGVLVLTTAGLLAYRCRADSLCYSGNLETYIAALFVALWSNQSTAMIVPVSARRRLVRKAANDKNMLTSNPPTAPNPPSPKP